MTVTRTAMPMVEPMPSASRAQMSRPSWSVPSGCANDGACSLREDSMAELRGRPAAMKTIGIMDRANPTPPPKTVGRAAGAAPPASLRDTVARTTWATVPKMMPNNSTTATAACRTGMSPAVAASTTSRPKPGMLKATSIAAVAASVPTKNRVSWDSVGRKARMAT